MEIWKDCYGYEGLVEVSNKGRVRNLGRYIKRFGEYVYKESIIYKQSNDKDGYKLVSLSFKGVKTTERVHRLVLLTFRYSKNNKELTVNHIDGIKGNNNLENLEWATNKQNTQHAIETGLIERKGRKKYTKKCVECGKKYIANKEKRKFCTKDCYYLNKRKVKRPSKEQLKKDIFTKPMELVGEKYGVTGNAVRKWCRNYGLPTNRKEINKEKGNKTGDFKQK